MAARYGYDKNGKRIISVTEVIRVAYKFLDGKYVDDWKTGLAFDMGVEFGRARQDDGSKLMADLHSANKWLAQNEHRFALRDLADIGTAVHSFMETELLKRNPEAWAGEDRPHFDRPKLAKTTYGAMSALSFLKAKESVMNVHAIERKVFLPEDESLLPFSVAGRVDLDCTYHGQRVVMDWKTSAAKSLTHIVQLSAYSKMLEPTQGKMGAVIVYLKKDSVGFMKPIVLSENQIEKGWKMFIRCAHVIESMIDFGVDVFSYIDS